MKPSRGDFNPKKKIDQRMFSTSWTPKRINAVFAFLTQIRYNETPINKNNEVQTGAKTQLGGLKTGWFKVVYQVLTAGAVKKEPIIPASWHIIIEIISLK
jgi:hypothetical protein